MKPWTQDQVNSLLAQVIAEAKAADIPVSSHIAPVVKINGRLKARFGSCKKEKKLLHTLYTIEISKLLLEADVQKLKEILAHEVLHTCPNSMNHGQVWKNHSQIMEQRHRYQIRRTGTYPSLGLADPRQDKPYRYKIECKNCGQLIYRRRKSRLTTATNHYLCRCGGKLVCQELKTEK